MLKIKLLSKISNAAKTVANKVSNAASKVKNKVSDVANGVKNYFQQSYSFSNTLAQSINPISSGSAGQGAMDTILTLVITGVVLVIGVFIFGEVEGAIDYGGGENTATALENIVDGLYNAYGMTPILLLVLVAGAIITVLMRFRRS